MKSRTILAFFLFISISFFSFSLVSFGISFVVKDEQLAKPAKPLKKAKFEEARSEELLYFGANRDAMSSSNVFDASMRAVSMVDASGTGMAAERPKEITQDDIDNMLAKPEMCPAAADYQLLGTAYAIPESESSMTIALGKGKEGSTLIVSFGEEIEPGISLVGVRRNLVVLKTNMGLRCMGDNVGKELAKAPTPDAMKQAAGADAAGGNDDLNVRQLGQNRYAVSRDDLNRATANLNSLASEARIVPDRQENGFKIFSIRPGSIWSKIGVQNGDVIKSLNGIELSSPDKALEAYQRLRNANKLSMDIVRRGKKETMDYVIE